MQNLLSIRHYYHYLIDRSKRKRLKLTRLEANHIWVTNNNNIKNTNINFTVIANFLCFYIYVHLLIFSLSLLLLIFFTNNFITFSYGKCLSVCFNSLIDFNF